MADVNAQDLPDTVYNPATHALTAFDKADGTPRRVSPVIGAGGTGFGAIDKTTWVAYVTNQTGCLFSGGSYEGEHAMSVPGVGMAYRLVAPFGYYNGPGPFAIGASLRTPSGGAVDLNAGAATIVTHFGKALQLDAGSTNSSDQTYLNSPACGVDPMYGASFKKNYHKAVVLHTQALPTAGNGSLVMTFNNHNGVGATLTTQRTLKGGNWTLDFGTNQVDCGVLPTVGTADNDDGDTLEVVVEYVGVGTVFGHRYSCTVTINGTEVVSAVEDDFSSADPTQGPQRLGMVATLTPGSTVSARKFIISRVEGYAELA